MTKVNLIGFSEASLIDDYRSILNACELVIINPNDLMSQGTDPNTPHIIGITRDPKLRYEISLWLDRHNCNRLTFIHPTSTIEKTAHLGIGTFIGPYCHIGSNVALAPDTMIAPYCMISHNAKIGRGTILHPGVMIAGNAQVGDKCKCNLRSTVLDYCILENEVELGACSTATKNLTSGYYVGTPARKVKNG